MIFAERNCTIKYLKGKDNYVGDCLSRLMSTKSEEFDTIESVLTLYGVNLNSVQALLFNNTLHDDDIDENFHSKLLFKKLEDEDNPDDATNIIHETMPIHERVIFGALRTTAVANIDMLCSCVQGSKHEVLT